jgi:hypothetical protein
MRRSSLSLSPNVNGDRSGRTIWRIRSWLENHISHRINERKGISRGEEGGGDGGGRRRRRRRGARRQYSRNRESARMVTARPRNAEMRKSRRAPTKQYRVFIRLVFCRSECTIGSQTGRALRRQAGPSSARPSRASRSFCL